MPMSSVKNLLTVTEPRPTHRCHCGIEVRGSCHVFFADTEPKLNLAGISLVFTRYHRIL